ncbi:hypothetical protein WH47_10141 [Habropoda laboriosa]|uniref:Uncharacterized protein n=1 Tax=Habropoda laboriosa TaxID=597456 RepID=A0A0L7R4C7_9HYME|nr:hypothetical protein WH47_10141 [Habropoda laboriosa]
MAAAKTISDVYYVHRVHNARHSHRVHHLSKHRDAEELRKLLRFERVVEEQDGNRTKRYTETSTEENTYEERVEKMQNTSTCSYRIEPVMPDTNIKQLMHLQHIKCNETGQKCHGSNKTYCCVQTYKMINFKLGDGPYNQMKIFTGCVCAIDYGMQAKNTVEQFYMP